MFERRSLIRRVECYIRSLMLDVPSGRRGLQIRNWQHWRHWSFWQTSIGDLVP
jgi:hypothetical protein